jgi:hypothetical protein
MAQIEIAYRLIPDTLLHGQFLVDMYTLDPEARIVKSYEYEWVKDTQVYEVWMEREVAILQKLKYGDCLAGTKKPKPTPEEKEEQEKMKLAKYKMKKFYDLESDWKNHNIWMDDDYYIAIKEEVLKAENQRIKMEMLKERPPQKDREGFIFDLKSISKFFNKDI